MLNQAASHNIKIGGGLSGLPSLNRQPHSMGPLMSMVGGNEKIGM